MCLCLYAFARRRVSAPYAAVAMLTATMWAGYASNGRPYGLMLGLAGLSLVAWQSAAEGRRRPLALAVLAASLAAGVATHYYAGPPARPAGPRGIDEDVRIPGGEARRPDLGRLRVSRSPPCPGSAR